MGILPPSMDNTPSPRKIFAHRHTASSFDREAAPYDTVASRLAGRGVKPQLLQPSGSGEYASWLTLDRYLPMSAAVGDFASRAPPARVPAGARPTYDLPDSAVNPFRFAKPEVGAPYGEAYVHPKFGHLSPWPSPRRFNNSRAATASSQSVQSLRASASMSLNATQRRQPKHLTGGVGGSPRWPAPSPLSSHTPSVRASLVPAYRSPTGRAGGF